MTNSFSWDLDDWSAALSVLYAGSYEDNLSKPSRSVGAWATYNAHVSYRFSGSSALDGCTLMLDVQNLFDRDPPFVNNSAGVGYDRENADMLNRTISLRLKKDW